MTAPLRVGVAGTGWFAETAHLAALNSHPRAEIAALYSRKRSNAEAVSARHGGPVVFTDYGEMVTSGLLDAVVIVTPDFLHREMTLAALAAGLHVLCEKPLARTAADARDMFEAAQAAGRVHMSMLTWRWFAVPAFAKCLVADGYIGRVRDARFSLVSDYGDDLIDGWRFDPDRGTGILGDLGSHLIDLARWYVGEITDVSGRLTRTDVLGTGPDSADTSSLLHDSATVQLQFAGGATGSIHVSGARLVGDWPIAEVRLFGDEGSLKLDFGVETEGRLSGWRRGDQAWSDLPIPPASSGSDGPNPSILDLPSLAPFTNLQVADRLFVDAVLDGIPAAPTFEDGWRVQEVIDAVLTSDRRKCWVPVRG